jgi:hypothetical protein
MLKRSAAGGVALVCALASAMCAQSTEQRLWRLAAGASVARGDELLAAAFEPGPNLYAAVDFVTRTASAMRSIGYFLEYARFGYDDGSFWGTVRTASGGSGAPVIAGPTATLASLGTVGKIGPIFGRLRPYGSLSLALFKNDRGALTTPGITPSEPSNVKLGTKSGVQTGIGVGADFMGRRLGVTADAGYQLNWSSSRLDNRYRICDGTACEPAARYSQTFVARLGVALVRGGN